MRDAIDIAFPSDVIIVGGGLAGLIAANLVARAGRRAILLERSSALGGRAVTQVEQGIHFNLGPHALYCSGRAFRLFRELEIPFSGRFPTTRGGLLIADDATYPLPRGLRELLFSRRFSLPEKLTAIKILGSLGRLETRGLDGVPLREWVEQMAGHSHLALFFLTLFRVATYSDDADRMSAGAALDQLKLALKGNVWYLDTGWQTLVDGLRKAPSNGAPHYEPGRELARCRATTKACRYDLRAVTSCEHARWYWRLIPRRLVSFSTCPRRRPSSVGRRNAPRSAQLVSTWP